MKKSISMILCLVMLLAIVPSARAENVQVMTADEFIGYLYVALNRKTKYSNNFPYNVGYFDGTYISWDCWNLGKTIIATRGETVNNYSPSSRSAYYDSSIGLSDTNGNGLKKACGDTLSSDFSNIVPGEWLFRDRDGSCYHVGYYVGNRQVIEITTDGTSNVQLTTIDDQGHSSLRSNSWAWTYHGKVPWISYSTHSDNYLSNCTYYPAYLTVKARYDKLNMWSLPCNSSTDSNSYKIYDNAIPLNASMAVTGLYLNTQNNYWYKCSYDGKTGYVYCENVTTTNNGYSDISSGISYSGKALPSELTVGKSYAVDWTISSARVPLYSVTGTIIDQSTGETKYTGTITNINSNSKNLNKTDVDNKLSFEKLNAGTYILRIEATAKNNSSDGSWLTTDTITVPVINCTFTESASGSVTPSTYTVQYNANGGTGAPSNQTKTQGTALTLSSTVPKRTGYTFKGWSTSSGGSAQYQPGGSYTTDAGVTLYAVWDINYYHFDLNGYKDGVNSSNITGYGTCDIYVNGTCVAQNVSDFYDFYPYGTSYAVRNIRPAEGYSYEGVNDAEDWFDGTISHDTDVFLRFDTITDISEEPTAAVFNGHTYLFFTTPRTWYAANKICEWRGGHLATITSQEENDFIATLAGASGAWLGGTDRDSEGNWTWITGESFSYTNWYPGEPNNTIWNHEGSENYMNFSMGENSNGSLWNDTASTDYRPFVCEIDSVCYLNLNGLLDGNEAGSIRRYGTADVYINGNLVADDCVEYFAAWPAETTYEIKDIKPLEGYSYDGISSIAFEGYTAGARTGTLSGKTNVRLTFHTSPSSLDESPEPAVFGGHTYYYFSTPVTWYDAKALCENMGGHLVTVTSDEETNFLLNLVKERYKEESGCYIWLGATDRNSEGNWQWITGENLGYTKWFSDEPNNSIWNDEGAENFAQFYTWQGDWNDTAGCSKMPFVCEIDSASYTLNFDANGGTGSMTSLTPQYKEPVTIPNCSFEKSGYTFSCWNLRRDSDACWYVYDYGFLSESELTEKGLSKTAYLPDTTMWIGGYDGSESYTFVAVWAQPDLVLPAALTSIEEEAFIGGEFRFVKLPENAVSIGRNAFADCPNLVYIYIPPTVTDIDSDAFGNAANLTIIGASGSVAETYAREHGFAFQEG